MFVCVCDCEKEMYAFATVCVCLLERHMKICLFSGFVGCFRELTCVHACVYVYVCVHKLPAPELEGNTGTSANPLLGDLGGY